MTNDMKLRRFSPETIKLYVYAVKDISRYYNSSPDLISEQEVYGYLLYLEEERKLTTIFSRPDLKKLFKSADTLRNRVMHTKTIAKNQQPFCYRIIMHYF